MSVSDSLSSSKTDILEEVLAKRKDIFLLMRRRLKLYLDEADRKLSNETNDMIRRYMSNTKLKQSGYFDQFVISEIKRVIGEFHWIETLKFVDSFLQDMCQDVEKQ